MDENNCAGLVRLRFTPLSRFPVKRLNGTRLSSRKRGPSSLLRFEDRFTMRRTVKDHREKEEKDKRERGKKRKKGVKKGEKERKRKNREGGR